MDFDAGLALAVHMNALYTVSGLKSAPSTAHPRVLNLPTQSSWSMPVLRVLLRGLGLHSPLPDLVFSPWQDELHETKAPRVRTACLSRASLTWLVLPIIPS